MTERDAVSTTILIPRRVWQLLRGLAEQRALARGGRASASRVLVELVEAEAARREAASAEAPPRD